jgi:glyoxylate reductase
MKRAVLKEQIADAVGLYATLADAIDVDLLDGAPILKVVSNMAVGVDNIDLDACHARGIAVGHTPGVLTDATADTAWMLLLAASRRLVEGVDQVRNGEWGPWDPVAGLGRDVARTTLGIIGMGRIGEAVARRASGFEMDVVYHSRTRKPSVEALLGVTHASFVEVLSTADHVVIAVDLNAETVGLIGPAEFAVMKPTANLVNVARGAVVDTGALHHALVSGSIRCAGLDVTDPEPLPANHPLVGLANCTIIPHIGSATWETRVAMADLAADNLIAGLLDEPLPHAVMPGGGS